MPALTEPEKAYTDLFHRRDCEIAHYSLPAERNLVHRTAYRHRRAGHPRRAFKKFASALHSQSILSFYIFTYP
jgi:hypothetical protein